ncbi:unnamed protein product [Ranitomeya imitator]|uniref:BHLH domain-containing protein n=1 Tax=Ranitomeya imitator TaxID=111125 RepID=A0ABN9MJQ7_9NEOB|nr:unnamed protein product [Ranitomeya imitator]
MDMLDQGLDSSAAASHDKGQEADEVVELQDDDTSADEHTAVAIAAVQQAAFSDGHNIQYQFRTENNGGQVPVPATPLRAERCLPCTTEHDVSSLCSQVTYRVVQVTDGQLDGQGGHDRSRERRVNRGLCWRPTGCGPGSVMYVHNDCTSRIAVIQNPFSNGGSPSTDAVSGEARFAYFPASTVGDTTAVSVQTTDPALTQAGGQFYVMMTPQDVIPAGTQRTIAPRTHPYSPKMDGNRTPRDERRRAQHNEVERRRRDKINNWIVQLSKIIPDCNTESSKTGAGVIDPLFSGSQQSKGGILSKACDYIRELRQTNQRMQETFKEAERLQMDNEMLRQQIEEQKNENTLLRAQLAQHGIEVVEEAPRQ